MTSLVEKKGRAKSFPANLLFSPPSLSGEVVAVGIDTWSLCWYGKPGSSLLCSLRSLATVQAGRACLVPTRVADHRIGWFPESGLVFAEGHPAGTDLCGPSDLSSAVSRVLAHMKLLGIPTLSLPSTTLRRLDVAVDVSIDPPAAGLALLERLGRESYGPGKVVTYRYQHRVQTVVLKSKAGRSQARVYDKGSALGVKRPGHLLRFEAQWRFGNGFRPYLETLNASSLRHRFNSRFDRVRATAAAFHLNDFSDLTNRLNDAVSSGSLTPSRARSLAGYLLLLPTGVDQGASRTRCELDRECRALGISTSVISPPSTYRFDSAQLFDECMSVDTWL